MRKLLAFLSILASPALAQTPAGVINAPIYATGYISQGGGTNVTTNIPPQPNHPTNLNIYTTGAISGTWTIKLPNPAFEGQMLSFNCGAAANTISVTSSDGSTIDSTLPTSCSINSGFTIQFDQRSNIWRNIGSNNTSTFKPFTGIASQWPWQLNTDGTWTLRQPAFSDLSGTISASQLIAPGSTTFGAVKSSAAGASQFATGINTSGVVTYAQPDANDVTFTQTGTGAVQRTTDSRLKDFVSVKDFGAKGDGTTDDTPAWNAAVTRAAAIGAELYCPVGTYKITSSIVTTTDNTKTLSIRGPGGVGCAITPVFSSGQPVIKADLSALCWDTQTPCLSVKGVYFAPPTGAGASTTDVLEATNHQFLYFADNIISGAYRRGLVLTAAYSSIITHNFAYNMRGSFIVATSDPTMNNTVITYNTVTGSGITNSEPAFNLGPATGQTVSPLIMGNNMNGNYGCFLIHGLVATNFISNFCEASTAYSIISDPASTASTGLNFIGNTWSQNPDTNIKAITNSVFDFENLYNNNFIFDGTYTVNVKAGTRVNYAGASTFPDAAKTQTVKAGSTFTVGTPSTYALSVGNNNLDLGMGCDGSFCYLQSWSGKPLKLNGVANSIIIGADGIQLASKTFAGLPTCNAGAEGKLFAVTDATSTTFNAALAGGGGNHVMGYCNGTAWVVH